MCSNKTHSEKTTDADRLIASVCYKLSVGISVILDECNKQFDGC